MTTISQCSRLRFFSMLAVPLVLTAQYRGYVTRFPNTLAMVNTSTNVVVSTLTVGHGPQGVGVTPDGARVYVANFLDDTVSVIDTVSDTVMTPIHVGHNPSQVAVAPDGAHVYVSNSGSSSVSEIDTTTDMVTHTFSVGGVPQGLAVTPDGSKVYVPNSGIFINTVSVISTLDHTVSTLGGTPGRPFDGPIAVAISPHGGVAYVANAFGHSVSIISTDTGNLLRTVDLGREEPDTIAVTPSGTSVYVAGLTSDGGALSVIDALTDNVTLLPIGITFPVDIAITPDGTSVYVTDQNSGYMVVVKTDTNTMMGRVDIGEPPSNVGFANVVFLLELAPLHLIEPEVDEAVLNGEFTLAQNSSGINLPASPVSLVIGGLSVTIPANSFHKIDNGGFLYSGVIDGSKLTMSISPQGGNTFSFSVDVEGGKLNLMQNPVSVKLSVGNNIGTASVTAQVNQ